MGCHNRGGCEFTYSLESFLDTEDEKYALSDRIDERADEFMAIGSDYYPFSEENLREALSEIDVSDLVTLLPQERILEAGESIAELVTEYWYTVAHSKASLELQYE